MKINLTKAQKFTIGVGIQAVILLVIILLKVATLQSGTEVLLKIQPVDPRDMFRGDYMTFTYDISNITTYESLREGEMIYVPLYRSGQFWLASQALKIKPREGLFLVGRVKQASVVEKNYGSVRASVIYGLEQYYIPEGTGQNIRIDENSFAKVAVDANGKGVVKQIYINGKPFPQK